MIDNAQLINDLFEINTRICFNLWNLCDVNSIPEGLSPRLIFPEKDSKVRISEQEARILCCELLNRSSYYYSIETPTKSKYVQKGQFGTRARTDLTLYKFENSQFNQVANIEFKAHKGNYENIRKDIEKLIKEGFPGNWFHTMKNFNGHTVTDMFEWLKTSILKHSETISSEKISIIFCFCFLKNQQAYMRQFLHIPSRHKYESYVTEFFDPSSFDSSSIDGKWRIISQDAVVIKPKKEPENSSQRPIWERTVSFLNNFDLKAKNWLNLDIELFRELLHKVESNDPAVDRPFSSKASKEFHKWFQSPNRPLAESAYALLSNWFLGEGAWYKGTNRSKYAGNLWDALFCVRPSQRLTDPQSNHKILKERFDSWWSKQLDYQEK